MPACNNEKYSLLFFKALLLGWSFPLLLFSQASSPDTKKLVDDLQVLSKQKSSDLVYFQTSKGIYETEEDVWFKCYVLNPQSYTLSAQSKTLFVQLINDKTQQAVWEEKYEIKNGIVDGHLYLQDSLQAGGYTLTAYSPHSFYKNTSEFYAARKLRVVKKITENRMVVEVTKDSVFDFKMFPEGGHLVSGIRNTLAFKATNSKCEPVIVSGTLFENNKPLIEFKSVHAGMGRFVFKPDINKTYYVEISNPKSTKRYSIPKIQTKGMSMQLVGSNKDFLLFNIAQNKALKETVIYMRLQVRGEVYSLAKTSLNSQVKIRVPLKDVPKGIAEVTLFNANFEPICERLVFIKPDQKLYIKTTLDKSEYSIREKATLKIQVTDEHQQPVVAHLGVSIYDKIYKNPKDAKNIVTHYHLTTQLKGKLYNPAYYFDLKSQNRKEALNLLLLTQGWRRYVWNETNLKELSRPKQIVFDDIKGKITLPKKLQKKPQQSLPALIAYNPQNEGQKKIIFVDSTKTFTIEPKHLKMGRQVYLKLLASQKPKYTFNINDYAFKAINAIRKTKAINYPLVDRNTIKPEKVKPFKYPSDIKVLDEVMVKAKKRKVHRDKYLGKLDSIAKLEMTTDYVCKENILNCPVHGPFEKGNKKPVEGKIYGIHWRTVYEEHGGPPPSGIIPKHPPYKYPVLTDEYLMSRFNLLRVKGYYGKREFYQPVYDNEKSIEDPFPDYRNTLYWNPSVITNEKGVATLEFFCSDINTNFIGNIEGVGSNGLLGNVLFEFFITKLTD
ncbi:hypothetical protein [Seonamhaeicola aphaedonensis]|uniref:MG2 domain-containing protein n=1 Tax=Seonamhaeicola aphaedonensis TaxID=1461338 RepID=A0A3D9H440_9FLAO|nr:hypothetical protein [Seonamhaeicola aphaedonensis]RED44240.1 hypothetical protein DFQ02_1153 [Seonamhaeicola aphaedonensis]